MMPNACVYTPDLYFCYQAFARQYPDRATDMYQALEWVVKPTNDRIELYAFVTGFGAWLAKELNQHLKTVW